MIRDENVRLGRNESSMPVSLDSLEIVKHCNKRDLRKSFPTAVYTSDTDDEYRMFMDAVINIDFTDELNLDRIGVSEDDLNHLCPDSVRLNIRAQYKNLVAHVKENEDSWKKYSETGKDFDRVQDSYKECCKDYHGIVLSMMEILWEEYDPRGEEIVTDKLKLRNLLYMNGFDAETRDGTKHYVLYKRSASKAKAGSCLFIWDELYEHMQNEWTWMSKPIAPEEYVDLTSVRAYEALTLSSITKTFPLKKENILIIDSPTGNTITGNRRILCHEHKGDDDEIILRTIEECENCPLCARRNTKVRRACREEVTSLGNRIWDGQALLDESVFDELYPDENEFHGMVLLRNKFFKACAFNTKIKKYYAQNKIKTVTDMFGNQLNAADIKLIITPDCLKYLKFAADLFDRGSENKNLKAAYSHWLVQKTDFGVVKEDKPSNRGGKHKIGYQILNTLPFTPAETEGLFNMEKDYLDGLYSDIDKLMRIIPKDSAKGRFIYTMLEAQPDRFSKTPVFRKYRTQLVNNYKQKVMSGELFVEGDMYTLCSMPFEMLKFSAYPDEEIKPLIAKDEVYIYGLKPGNRVVLCRYPHLSAGSVCVLKSASSGEYTRWFNLKDSESGSNIVIVSPWESNIMAKLGGADFDSDTALFIKNDIIQAAAGRLVESKNGDFLTEVLGVEEDGLPVAQAGPILKGDAILSGSFNRDKSELDDKLSVSQIRIGGISNDTQLFNSYLMEELMKKKPDAEYVRLIYECIIKMAVLNELEIDRAKHAIRIGTYSQNKMIRDTEYKGKYILKRQGISDNKVLFYQPMFFYNARGRISGGKYCLRKKGKEYWNCPLDIIAKKAKDYRKPRETNAEAIDLASFFDPPQNNMEQSRTDQKKKIESYLEEALRDLIMLDKSDEDSSDRYEERLKIHARCISRILKFKINENTMRSVIRDIVCTKKTVSDPGNKYYNPFLFRNQNRALGLLFMAGEKMDEDVVVSCLKTDM